MNSYDMSDHDGADSESDSDEEDACERRRRIGKKVRLRWVAG